MKFETLNEISLTILPQQIIQRKLDDHYNHAYI